MHGVGEGGNHSTHSVLSLLDAGVDFRPEEVGFLSGESGNASLQHCIKSIIPRFNELLFNSKLSASVQWVNVVLITLLGCSAFSLFLLMDLWVIKVAVVSKEKGIYGEMGKSK